MLVHARLVEDDVLFGSTPAATPGRGHFAGGAAQLVGVPADGDRVHVDDAIDALMRLLHFDIALDGAEVVAQVQIARGLGSRKRAAQTA